MVCNMEREERGKYIRQQILDMVTEYFCVHGYAPSIREIGDAVGLASTASVTHHINRLIAEGKIETDAKAGAPRAFRVAGMKVVKRQEEKL